MQFLKLKKTIFYIIFFKFNLNFSDITQSFKLNFLNLDKKTIASIQKAWKDIEPKNKILFNPALNLISITTDQQNLNLFKSLIKAIDKPKKRIKLNLIALESQTEKTNGSGVNWGGIYDKSQLLKKINQKFNFIGASLFPSYIPADNPENGNAALNLITLPLIAPQTDLNAILNSTDSRVIIPIVFSGPDIITNRLNLLIHAFEAEKKINTSLKTEVVLNENETVKLFQGNQLPYYIKNIEINNQTVTTTTKINFFDIGIAIAIKAQIKKNNNIELEFFFETNEILAGSTQVDSTGIITGGPVLNNAKIKNKIILKNNTPQIISMLDQNRTLKYKNKIPWISDLPVIGSALFEGKAKLSNKEIEYLIITPQIIYE